MGFIREYRKASGRNVNGCLCMDMRKQDVWVGQRAGMTNQYKSACERFNTVYHYYY